MTAGAPNSGDDVELGGSATAPPPPPSDANGGPNAPHPSDPDPDTGVEEARAADEAAAAAAEEEDEAPWRVDDDPSGPTAPSPDEPAEPSSETRTDPPSSGDASEPAAPTAEAGGEGDEEQPGEPEPEPEPVESRSGAQTRPYTVLEEQEVVPTHLLTEAQKKTLAKHAVVGFVAREDQVVSRNTEAVLQSIYGEDGLPEHVSRVLALSERAYSPVALDLEPVQRSRLRIRK